MAKILTLEELSAYRLEKKDYKIGLCHGAFDLVHIDHIEHFRQAKSKCDFLVVSITPDKFINKGPGRPIFNEKIRAEYLSHIDYIDVVSINNDRSVCDVIDALKPNFYFKGAEYRDKVDVTNKIGFEKECVEKYGGELAFTETKNISSTNIINSEFNIFTKEQKQYIDDIKSKYTIDDIEFWLKKLKSLKVMVIGDPILDIYTYVYAKNMAMKSPNLSVEAIDQKEMEGGAVAIANHVKDFVNLVYLACSKDIWAYKERFITKNYKNTKLFEVCSYPKEEILKEENKQALDYINNNLDEVDLVLVCDFGHGFVTKEMTDLCLRHKEKFVAVNVQTNSANFGFNPVTKYKFFNFACLDERELRLPFSDAKSNVDDLTKKLKFLTACNKFLVTLGESGLNYYNFELDTINNSKSLAKNVIDTVGAGDAVFSIASLLVYVGCPDDLLAFISNCAGGLDTKYVGNENYITYSNIYTYIKGIIS